MRYVLCVVLLFGLNSLFGQDSIAGKVQSEMGEALLGATVLLVENEEAVVGSITDVKGEFIISKKITTKCTLRISYVGFLDKELILDPADPAQNLENLQIQLSAGDLTICIVDVEIGRYNDQEFLPNLVQTITIDEVRKLPATFFDPARLAQSFAGVANNNDQANGISIRGNNPAYFKWYLEGVEVLNPNHASNAGTFSDRPSQNAGGVNILSAQLLSKSQFYKSIYPTAYQNALAGIMGMSLRNGNRDERKHFVQVGLIGLETSSEGPFKKDENKGSYLFNYRYSTVGLLSQLGLDFGGEEIDFQDLAFNLSFPIKRGMLKVFAVGGLSNNRFTAPENEEDREEEKDNNNIDFSGDMGLVGINFDSYVGAKNRLNITSILSANKASRTSIDAIGLSSIVDIDQDQNQMLSTRASIAKRLPQGSWTNGVYHNLQNFEIRSEGLGLPNLPSTKDLIQRAGVFSALEYNWNKSWNIHAGLSLGVQDSPNQELELLIEPRVSLTKRWSNSHRVHLSSGLYSQSQAPRAFYPTEKILFELKNTKSWQNSIAYVVPTSRTEWRVEGFYQYLYDVPTNGNLGLSILNDEDSTIRPLWNDVGAGRNFGVESSLRYNDANLGWLAGVNATLYQSEYEVEGEWLSSRYDGRYIFNALLGKEWTKSETKTHGVHARLNILGGFRERAIDAMTSQVVGTTVFEEGGLFVENQKDYIRLDLSLFRKVEHKKFTSTISLDIQNLTNRENQSFAYYDTFLEEVVRRNQLGLLPILNYRIQF